MLNGKDMKIHLIVGFIKQAKIKERKKDVKKYNSCRC